jgi:putative copper export protein
VFTLEASVSAINYLIMALLVGSLATCVFLLPRSDEATAIRLRLIRFAVMLTCAFLVVHSFGLFVQGAKLTAGDLPSLDLLSRYVLRTQSGKIWLVRGVYAAIFLFVILRFIRSSSSVSLLLLSLPLAATRSLSGHAVAVRDNAVLIVVADSIHLIATACWAGVLPFLLYLLINARRTERQFSGLAATAITSFSRLAFCSVTVLVATGLFQSWTHVGRVDALTTTTYGNVLALKLTMFGSMLLLGALNFLVTKPAVLRSAASTVTPRFHRTVSGRIGAEAFLGVVILLLSGFLTTLPPAAHTAHTSPVAAGSGVHGGDSHETHGVSPPVGPTRFKPAQGSAVEIVSPKPGQTFFGDQVPIQFRLVKGKRGHHVHAYIDDELMGMFESEKGTLTGVGPGTHVLKLRVVAADHNTELDASDEVEFTVKTP